MLRDLTIQNYRSFKDFRIENLARVNLIVGMNNSGKTSLLEAAYLLVNQNNPLSLYEVLYSRGEIVERLDYSIESSRSPTVTTGYQVGNLFYRYDSEIVQNVSIQSAQDHFLGLEIQLRDKTQEQNLMSSLIPGTELLLSYKSENANKPVVQSISTIDGTAFEGKMLASPKAYSLTQNRPCHFLTGSILSFQQLSALWDNIVLTAEEDTIVAALNILEPNLERVSFLSNHSFANGVLLKLRGRQIPVPLSIMGDGMRRVLGIAISAVTAENSVLLVDEIDTGLHYQTQTDLWHLILDIAQRLDVQVFATTHSWDCITAFQEALNQIEDRSVGKLWRLSRRGEEIRAVEYTADELSRAVRQSIEVR